MPALCNAVYDAVGVRIDEVPVTPEKVLRALDDKANGGAGRFGPTAFPEIEWPDPLLVPPPWDGGDGRATNDARESGKAKGAKPR
jgi:4-hydroxybenzoyl-CoA reductase subunit alpha